MSQVEQYCLNAVKNIILQGDCCIHTKDSDSIRSLIKNVHDSEDNCAETKFPDFVGEAGFIEHFAVTSGKSGRKGYTNKKTVNQIESQHIKSLSNDFENSEGVITFGQKITKFDRLHETLDDFHKSFKTTWKDHIDHLHHYTGAKHVSCFLVESDDTIAVHVAPKDEKAPDNPLYPELIANLYRRSPFYLSYDIEMLDYIYQFANDIDYCIFYSGMGSVEILQLTEIPKIKEFLSAYKIHIEPCPSIQMCRTIGYGVKS